MRKIIICLLIISGCLASWYGSNASSSDSATDEKAIAIGLIPEQNIFRQIERYEPLTEYLSGKIGQQIVLKILSRYGNIIDNFISKGLDGAFFGSFTYALAHEKLGLEVLARPQGADGTSTYYGLIFVRSDSGIKTARDMRGKIFAFVDKATTAGYLLPLDFFKEHGIKDYRGYFGETYFAGSHEAAIYDVLNRKSDIGAAKNTVYFRIAERDSKISEELTILVRSPDVPENALAVRKDMDGELKKRLKEALLYMHEEPSGRKILKDFGAERFIVTTDTDYEAVFQYAEHVGLDLATYDYINE